MKFRFPILTIAWRNVWRNRRRSMITAASVVMAVFLVVLVESLNDGVFDYLIDNEIRLYTSHIEIQKPGFHIYRRSDQVITEVDDLMQLLHDLPYTEAITTRLETLVLVSFEDISVPGLLQGIQPNVANSFFDYATAVTFGTASDSALVMGAGLAASLGVTPGDSVVLLGQSYRGRIVAGVYPVGGLIDIPIQDINNHLLYAPIPLVQYLVDVPGGATSVMASLNHKHLAQKAQIELNMHLDTTNYEVRTWQQTLSARMLNHQLREVGVSFMKLVLYLIMGFGIFGTIMLTNHERKKEYKVMMAVGMNKKRLATLMSLEMVFISTLGLLAGIALTYPLVAIMHYNPLPITGQLGNIMKSFNVEPIIQMSLNSNIFLQSGVLVFLLTIGLTTLAIAIELFKR